MSLIFLEPQLRQAHEVMGAKLYRAGYIYSYDEVVHIFRQKPSLYKAWNIYKAPMDT